METEKKHPSQAALWADYLASLDAEARAAAEKRNYTAWHFCDDEANADELGALAASGRKRATAASVRAYFKEGQALPEIGDLSVIIDWRGRALCVIETTRLEILPLCGVGADFAAREGEGDGSLAYWLDAHRRYFAAEHEALGLPFDDSIPVLCEDFSVVWPAPAHRSRAASRYAAARRQLRSNWELLDAPWKSDSALGVPVPAQEAPPGPGAALVPLAAPDHFPTRKSALPILLAGRRSRRKFDHAGVLGLDQLSYLLWAAAGVVNFRDRGSFRTAASGGARHPLDLYVFAARVEGLEPGLYRHLPVEASLVLERAGDDSAALDAALRGQYWNAAAYLVWAAEPYRSEWRYGPAAQKLVALDAGHSCQNLYLACEDLGLGTCAVGAYDQAKLDAYLGLDGSDRLAVYAAPLGPLPPA